MKSKKITLISYKMGDINVTVVYFPLWHGPLKNYKKDKRFKITYIKL